MLTRRTQGDEAGFTLVELLVSTVILGIIMLAVSGALFLTLKASSQSQVQLDQSNSEQLLAHNLAKDVAAACSHAASVAGTGPTCNRSPNPSITSGTACGTPVAFAMDLVTTPTGTAADTTVGYSLVSNRLTRVQCAFGGSAPTSTINISGDITSITPSSPVSGACANQFQVAVTAAGSSKGLSFPAYSYTLCEHQRTG